MNKFDASEFERFFTERGLVPAPAPEQADVVHVLTCCVRQKAEDKFFSLLGALRKHKLSGGVKVIGVSGCIPELRDVGGDHAFVDYVIGSGAPEKYYDQIEAALIKNLDMKTGAEPVALHMPQSGISEFVTVMRGCTNYCTYCVVPAVRGPEQSRSVTAIRADARRRLQAGAKEIILLGQNALAYGMDLTRPATLLDALSAVHDLPGLRRVRFVTSHPAWVTEEFLHGLKFLPLVCAYFHIPFQAGDNETLKRMNRKYTVEEYIEKIAMIRRLFPEAGISADVIVGFPGETDAQFQGTVRLMKRVVVNQAYMFKYSPRPGTPAERWGDDVPQKTKEERLAVLIDTQREISLRLNRAQIESTMEVMVDTADHMEPGRYKGRTRCNRVADFTSTKKHNPGDIVSVLIDKATPHALIGRLSTRHKRSLL
jgi:tRNA-2-methylthio-N6-dimethylallyladenosine synthase